MINNTSTKSDQSRAFCEITRAAKELNIVCLIAATSGEGNDVIEL